jgi:hypothetical protein
MGSNRRARGLVIGVCVRVRCTCTETELLGFDDHDREKSRSSTALVLIAPWVCSVKKVPSEKRGGPQEQNNHA